MPEPDTAPPAWPAEAVITLRDVTETTATVDWPVATDDVGVARYVLMRDGQPLAETPTNTVHPDGASTTVTRDSAGRATAVAAPWATSTFGYSPMTG